MNKLLKLLIIYTAFANTVVLIILLMLMRNINQVNSQLPQEVKSLKQEIEKLSLNASSSGKLTEEIARIRAEIADSKQAEERQVLGADNKLPANQGGPVLRYIKIADDSFETIDVYSTTSFSSPVVGKIQADKSYEYIKKENSWYLIKLPEEQEGFVNSRFVKETSQ